jgi:hypothetical protein
LAVGAWWTSWGLGAFCWVGLLTAYFAAASWLQRRFPLDAHSFTRPWTHYILPLPFGRDWAPPDQAERVAYGGSTGALVALMLYALLLTFFVSPEWFVDFILPGDSHIWARYDTAFQRGLLGPLLVVMGVRLILFALALVNERWRVRLEPLRFGLWVASVSLLVWALFRWRIFALLTADFFFKAWLLCFLTLSSFVIVLYIRSALTRVHIPRMLKRGGNR